MHRSRRDSKTPLDVSFSRWAVIELLVIVDEREAGIEPFHSADPDSDWAWRKDAGVHQSLPFPVHPDLVRCKALAFLSLSHWERVLRM
jgi:hypothetical protein